jgi:hypothetical protein
MRPGFNEKITLTKQSVSLLPGVVGWGGAIWNRGDHSDPWLFGLKLLV